MTLNYNYLQKENLICHLILTRYFFNIIILLIIIMETLCHQKEILDNDCLPELEQINRKETNTLKYQKNHQKRTKGKRPHSPWWYLIGRITKRYRRKMDLEEDYSITHFRPLKLQVKKKDTIW